MAVGELRKEGRESIGAPSREQRASSPGPAEQTLHRRRRPRPGLPVDEVAEEGRGTRAQDAQSGRSLCTVDAQATNWGTECPHDHLCQGTPLPTVPHLPGWRMIELRWKQGTTTTRSGHVIFRCYYTFGRSFVVHPHTHTQKGHRPQNMIPEIP